MNTRNLGLTCLLLWPFMALGAAAPLGLALGDDDEKGKEEEEEKESEPIPEEDKDAYFALLNADIYTGTGTLLRGAGLLSKNGKIVEIGYEILIPGRDYYADIEEDERDFRVEILDAGGMRVYPGLVAISSSGLTGASDDFRDSIDPFSSNMILGLAAGITSTGQGRAAVKLKRYISQDPPLAYDFDGVVLSSKTYASMSWSSSSAKRTLREKFTRAAEYLREYHQWQIDVKKDKELKELKEPKKSGVDGSTLEVLKGELLPRFRADERLDLLGIARFAQEFGFRPVIDGCREGWTVADELGRAGAMAILTARDRRDKGEELRREGGSSIENATLLSAAGVQVAIVPSSKGISLSGIVGRDIMHLTVEVDFAIRGGLSERLALDSITRVPARMMGISHRVGTLEVGKDCDLIVTDGDLLHYETFVQYAVVDGDLVYDKQDELYYAHIRPRPESSLAPEETLDAGENEGSQDEDEDDGDGDEDEEKEDDEE
jgi:hypothetical protein